MEKIVKLKLDKEKISSVKKVEQANDYNYKLLSGKINF